MNPSAGWTFPRPAGIIGSIEVQMTELTEIYHFIALTPELLTSGQPTRDQFSAIAAQGVQAVINLALTDSPNALPDEKDLVTTLGMDYHHIPVVWEEPKPADLDEFMDIMDRLQGRKVWVHCAANMRVSAFVALYRILRLGWDREKAFQDVRRIWNPDETETWKAFIATSLAHPLQS
jgi:uncharacterized protein (TIGR01244 family)